MVLNSWKLAVGTNRGNFIITLAMIDLRIDMGWKEEKKRIEMGCNSGQEDPRGSLLWDFWKTDLLLRKDIRKSITGHCVRM